LTVDEAKKLPHRKELKEFEAGQRFVFIPFDRQVKNLVAKKDEFVGENPPFFFMQMEVGSSEMNFGKMEKAEDQTTDKWGFRIPNEQTPDDEYKYTVEQEELEDFWPRHIQGEF
jgi:hypothetical protein